MSTGGERDDGPETRLSRSDSAPGASERPYPLPDGARNATGSAVMLAATRALMQVTSRAEASRVVRTAVTDLGGTVVPARQAGPMSIPVDVSLGEGAPQVVSAVDVGIPRLLLTQHLPVLVEIALAAAARAESGARRAGTKVDSELTDDADVVDAYFASVAAADAASAVRVIDRAKDRGRRREQLIRDVGTAQRRVGDRWFSGAWSIADEHAATAVSEQALTMLSPPTAPDSVAARLLLACAEGEWHTLPARLAGELARSSAVEIVVMGGSIPASHLGRHIRNARPAALLLSCTMATNLLGAARCIEAATAEGVPTIVGGAAWGAGQQRARRLGAVLHLEDAERIAWALELTAEVSIPHPEPIPREALMLDATAADVLAIAFERQAASDQWVAAATDHQRLKWLEGFSWLARHAAAAVACDDPTIMRSALAWSLDLLVPRGVPRGSLIESCDYLADAVEPDAPLAAALLRTEARLAATED